MPINIIKPEKIESRSFEIIRSRLNKKPDENTEDIVIRVIHSTADFDFAENMVFSENAVSSAITALQNGADIVTDTAMALAGINKKNLRRLGGAACCYMSDADVAREAAERGITRAYLAMEKAARLNTGAVFAIGNAPTALIRLCELIQAGAVSPALVIGAPVGFVNVLEAKELLVNTDVEFIAALGNKGGSSVAVAVCNALLIKAVS